MNDANWHARKAVECNPHLPFAHAVAGYVLGFRREHDASLIEVNQATALNPNYTDWRLPMTFVMRTAQEGRSGRPDFYRPALPATRRAVDGHGVLHAETLRGCSTISARGRCAGAQFARQSSVVRRQLQSDGYIAKAREEMEIALRIDPKFTLELQARLASVCRKQDDIDHHLEGLPKAGLPER